MLVTFIVLVFAFVRVHRTLRAQIRELEALQGSEEQRVQSNVMKTEATITKTFLYMLIAFMLCYTPSLLMIYLMNFCTICSCQMVHWFRDLSFIFIVLNSCINPFLYAWRLPNFREGIKVLFKRSPQVTVTAGGAHTLNTRPTTSQTSQDQNSREMKTSPPTSTTNSTSNSIRTSRSNLSSGKTNVAFTAHGVTELTNQVSIQINNEH